MKIAYGRLLEEGRLSLFKAGIPRYRYTDQVTNPAVAQCMQNLAHAAGTGIDVSSISEAG